jgi:hypothetical protein
VDSVAGNVFDYAALANRVVSFNNFMSVSWPIPKDRDGFTPTAISAVGYDVVTSMSHNLLIFSPCSEVIFHSTQKVSR